MRDKDTRTRPEESDDGCGTCTTVHMSWPRHLRVSQIRIARPTDRLDEVVAFYRDGIGLTVVEPENPYWAAIGVTFEDPDGWRVVLVRAAGFIDLRPQSAEGAHHLR